MDAAVQRLVEMQKEFVVHKERLSLIVKNARAKADQEIDPGKKEMYELFANVNEELIDTALSFQADMLDIIVAEWNSDGDPDDETPDDDTDEDDEGDIIGIEAEHAKLLIEVLSTHKAMLDSAAEQPNMDPLAQKNIEAMKEKCESALKLVEDLTLPEEA